MAASRIREERTGLKHIYLEQFRVFGDENRIINSKYKEVVKSDLHQFGQQ